MCSQSDIELVIFPVLWPAWLKFSTNHLYDHLKLSIWVVHFAWQCLYRTSFVIISYWRVWLNVREQYSNLDTSVRFQTYKVTKLKPLWKIGLLKWVFQGKFDTPMCRVAGDRQAVQIGIESLIKFECNKVPFFTLRGFCNLSTYTVKKRFIKASSAYFSQTKSTMSRTSDYTVCSLSII